MDISIGRIIDQAREFVEECDIENYGNIGEMAQEAERHRQKLSELLEQLDKASIESEKCLGCTITLRGVDFTAGNCLICHAVISQHPCKTCEKDTPCSVFCFACKKLK